MAKNEIITGIRDNSSKKINTFRQAYFHLPCELENEVKESGLVVEKTLGVVGPSWEVPCLEEQILDNKKIDRLLEVSEMLENYPILSPKILIIGRKMAPASS